MKIGFVGGGRMAEAMIGALLQQRATSPHAVFASDCSAERRRLLKRRYAVNCYSKNAVVPTEADVLFLAVKPQNLADVIQDVRPVLTDKHLVISIVAGRRIASLESALGKGRVIRVMPNVGCLVAEAMSVFCAGGKAKQADRKLAAGLLGCFGRVLELPEDKLDAVTALSGSGPGFFAYFVKAFVDAAVKEGLNRTDAVLLATQTMLGAGRLMRDQQLGPGDVIKMVASPKGTTLAGLEVLERSKIPQTLRKTLRAAARRSRELSEGG